MRDGQRIGAAIPALNEARAIALTIGDIPAWVDRIVVADNGSTDGTGEIARQAGANVVREEERGYGAACLAALGLFEDIDIVVFLDGDRSDYPEDMHQLVDPILAGTADMVIASRTIGVREPGALTPQQQFGNWLATFLIHRIWGTKYTDLGPFRAIRHTSLKALAMADRNYGWTVEMQIKAIEQGLRVEEVPARYRRSSGRSKVSGTFKGSLMAGYKILYTIARHALRAWRRRKR